MYTLHYTLISVACATSMFRKRGVADELELEGYFCVENVCLPIHLLNIFKRLYEEIMKLLCCVGTRRTRVC